MPLVLPRHEPTYPRSRVCCIHVRNAMPQRVEALLQKRREFRNHQAAVAAVEAARLEAMDALARTRHAALVTRQLAEEAEAQGRHTTW